MDFKYIATNIVGPGCDAVDFYGEIHGCDHPGKCEDEKCVCLRYGANYDSSGLFLSFIVSDFSSPGKDKPVFECGSSCSCGPNCGNRSIQFGVQIPLDVCQTVDKGKGLRTLTRLKRGQFVCEYAGEVIDIDEASRRFAAQSDCDANYIFVLREHSGSLDKRKTIVTCIDPSEFGNLGRFINHSCDPNLSVVPIRYDSVVPHLCFFASRDIDCGKELSYDYAGLVNPTDLSTRPCYCKAKNCRKFLPLDKDLLRI